MDEDRSTRKRERGQIMKNVAEMTDKEIQEEVRDFWWDDLHTQGQWQRYEALLKELRLRQPTPMAAEPMASAPETCIDMEKVFALPTPILKEIQRQLCGVDDYSAYSMILGMEIDRRARKDAMEKAS